LTAGKSFNKKQVLVPLYASVITFLTYAAVYGFRKPFAAGTYSDVLPVMGIAYKSCLVISQVLGYMFSKFYGIKFIAELQRIGRGKLILILVSISWLSLLLFAVVPAPYNIPLLFINGFPLGLIWGIVFSFAEGRKATDFIGAALAVSFIFSSGFVKSVAGFLQTKFHVNEFWLPFISGLVFFLPLLLFIKLLEKIPPPSEDDKLLRTERTAMMKEKRKETVRLFLPGLFIITAMYVLLSIFRDIRDNFSADMWKEMGYANQPGKLVQTEIPITIIVLALIAAMILIRNNFKAFIISHVIIAIGFFVAGIASYLFLQQQLSPFYWMMLTGLGLYMGYIPFNCVLFERMVAAFSISGNAGFLMYLADSYGYLGSVIVTVSKSIFNARLSWTFFYANGVIAFSVLGVAGTLVSAIYFNHRYKKQSSELWKANRPSLSVQA
jgi:MFS family permease